eukprot:2302111-Amphidinium_carterae.1
MKLKAPPTSRWAPASAPVAERSCKGPGVPPSSRKAPTPSPRPEVPPAADTPPSMKLRAPPTSRWVLAALRTVNPTEGTDPGTNGTWAPTTLPSGEEGLLTG